MVLGAVGGVVAGELLSRGHAVDLVTGSTSIAEAINASDVTLERDGRTRVLPARAYARMTQVGLNSRYDIVLLAMMAGQVVGAAREALPYLAFGGYFVALQNGFVEDAIARVC